MIKPYIEFKKQRDFSEIISDTFKFIRSEFKPLMKAILNISGPAFLIYMLSLAAYSYVVGDIFNFAPHNNSILNSDSLFVSLIVFLIYFISAIVTYLLIASATLFYIKSYIVNEGKVDVIEVKKNVYKTFWSLFGIGFLKSLTLIIAMLLCFLPVLYAMVPMAVVYSIYVFEPNSSVIDVYSKSYNLVNADFWITFAVYLVLFIIYYIIIFVFALPTTVLTMIGTSVFSGEIDPADLTDFTQNPILILLNLAQTFFQTLVNLILVIGGVLIYFHLHEKTTFTGTYDRISKIGQSKD